MSDTRNPELYLPASAGEILQFSRKLERLSMQTAADDGFHNEVLIDSSVTQADKSIQLVRFKGTYMRDHDVFKVTWSHAVPMSNIWEPVQSDGTTFTGDEETPKHKPGNLMVFDPEIDDDIEGYLESERELTVRRFYGPPETAEATIEFALNLVDDNYIQVERYFGYCAGVLAGDNLFPESLQRLVESGEPILDIAEAELSNSVVTRADLIVAASMLRRRRIMNQKTKAYRGAPLDIDDYTGLAFIDEI